MLSKFKKIGIIISGSTLFVLIFYLTVLKILEKGFSIRFNNISIDLILSGIFSIVFFTIMWKTLYSHSYHMYLKTTVSLTMRNLGISSLVASSVAIVIGFFQSRAGMAEEFMFLFIGVAGYFSLHILLFLWMRSLSRLGFFRKNVLVVGSPDSRFPVDTLFQDIGNTKINVGNLLRNEKTWIYRNGISSGITEDSICFNTHNLMLRLNVGEVVIFLGKDLMEDDLVDIVSFCMENSIGYYLVPDIATLPHRDPWNRMFSYIPIIERYSTARDSLTYISIKRLMDIVISGVTLSLFFPVGILIGLLIKLEDGGPVFYVSTRIGKNGKHIRFFKFRSMVMDAEKRKAELLRFNERKEGPLFKMKNDPRITRIGSFLRKYSIDEIPQLWNVLRGDMSLIGPRPHLPDEVRAYTDLDYLRLECIPGVSCLPQIYGRNSLSFREWVDYDLEYRKNWSLSLDFIIILRTIQVFLSPVFSRKGEGF